MPSSTSSRHFKPAHESRRLALTRGFSLVELVVVLGLSGLLALAAAPSFSSTADAVKLRSASNDFFSALVLARSESIKRNGRVVLCRSSNGASCSAKGDWEQGWLVFHDVNNNAVWDAGEAVLLRAGPLPKGLKLTGNQYVERYISFSPTGGTKLLSGAFQAGTLTLCRISPVSGEGRQIVINAAGRPRSDKVKLATCG